MSVRHAVAAAIDATAWAGVDVVNSAGDVGALSADATEYSCLPAFIHGFGSRPGYDLTSLLAVPWAAAGGAGTLTAGIDAAGRFYLEASDTDFELDISAANAWFGFPDAGVGLVGGDAPFRHTAASPWRRGVFHLPEPLKIHPDGGTSEEMPTHLPRVQNLVVWLRERGEVGDADDVYAGLTLEDADVTFSTYVVEADGRVSRCGLTGTFSYLVDSLRVMLGSRRDPRLETDPPDGYAADTSYVVGPLTVRTGADPAAPFLVAHSAELRRLDEKAADAAVALSGQQRAVPRTHVRGWEVRMQTLGPALGPTRDQSQARRAFNAAATGMVTLYPAWGAVCETRRHRPAWRAGEGDVETLLWTAAAEHPDNWYGPRRGGRLICRRDPDDQLATTVEAYTTAVDAVQVATLRLIDDVEEHPEQADERA